VFPCRNRQWKFVAGREDGARGRRVRGTPSSRGRRRRRADRVRRPCAARARTP
jgi:hypothetical protein